MSSLSFTHQDFVDEITALTVLITGLDKQCMIGELPVPFPAFLTSKLWEMISEVEMNYKDPADFYQEIDTLGLNFPDDAFLSWVDGFTAAIKILTSNVNACISKERAVDFVNSLEKLEVSSLSTQELRCSHCCDDFTEDSRDSTADEPPAGEHAPSAHAEVGVEELHTSQSLFESLDHDPIRTQCGHVFGRKCLAQAVTEVDSLCPICRRSFNISRDDQRA